MVFPYKVIFVCMIAIKRNLWEILVIFSRWKGVLMKKKGAIDMESGYLGIWLYNFKEFQRVG